MNRASSLRVFVAINLPDSLKDYLVSRQAEAETLGLPLRLVPRDNLHLTVLFLGSVPASSVPAIEQAMADTVRPLTDFEIILDQLNLFRDSDKPASWHVNVRANLPLSYLYQVLVQHLRVVPGLSFGEKNFVPHITLARFKKSVTEKAKFERLLSLPVRPVSFPAGSLDLMASDMKFQPPRYSLLKSASLAKSK